MINRWKQPVKLLVLDIDGTLLNPQKRIACRTRAAIQAAQQRGVAVTLATGRRYCVTMAVATELGGTLPLIIYDGAVIIDHPSGTLLHTDLFQATVAQQVIDILVSHGLQPAVHHIRHNAGEEIWTGPDSYDTVWIRDHLRRFPSHVQRKEYASCCIDQPDPARIVLYASEEKVMRVLPEIQRLTCAWNITQNHLQNNVALAIMNTSCSKASGVAALAHLLHIPLEQVMAIGDDNNDIEMLQTVGLGVAMGQASLDVQLAAHVVTATNAEDGAALAIEQYVLADG